MLPCADICFVLNVYYAVCFMYLCLVVNSLFFMLMGGGEGRGGVGREMEKDGRESNQSMGHTNE